MQASKGILHPPPPPFQGLPGKVGLFWSGVEGQAGVAKNVMTARSADETRTKEKVPSNSGEKTNYDQD